MSASRSRYRRLHDTAATTLEATGLVLRALLRHRMGRTVPLVVVMVLLAYLGLALESASPVWLLSRAALVTPFIYPLF